jgi:hypothetical protein
VGPRVPQRRSTKTGRSTKEGEATTRPLGLSRKRWRVALWQSLSRCTERMGKPGSCSYREFSREPEPLIYKTRPLPTLGSSSSVLLEIRRAHPLLSFHGVHYFCCAQAIPPRQWKFSPTNRILGSTVRFLIMSCSLPAISGPRPRAIRPPDNHPSPIRTNR